MKNTTLGALMFVWVSLQVRVPMFVQTIVELLLLVQAALVSNTMPIGLLMSGRARMMDLLLSTWSIRHLSGCMMTSTLAASASSRTNLIFAREVVEPPLTRALTSGMSVMTIKRASRTVRSKEWTVAALPIISAQITCLTLRQSVAKNTSGMITRTAWGREKKRDHIHISTECFSPTRQKEITN